MNNQLKDLFNHLNNNCRYLVLRNWDNLLDESIYGQGHEDIDVLCEDLGEFIKITGAKRVHSEKDRDNYVVPFEGMNVRFDVRWVGDGYYPEGMERAMLNNRRMNEQSVFIPSIVDYYYSLAYHALLQKPSVSEEYLEKLNQVRQILTQTRASIEQSAISIELCDFLKKNEWKFEYPNDPGVYVNYSGIKVFPVKRNLRRIVKRKLLLCKQRFFVYLNLLSRS